jgi:hypothetical protein
LVGLTPVNEVLVRAFALLGLDFFRPHSGRLIDVVSDRHDEGADDPHDKQEHADIHGKL